MNDDAQDAKCWMRCSDVDGAMSGMYERLSFDHVRSMTNGIDININITPSGHRYL